LDGVAQDQGMRLAIDRYTTITGETTVTPIISYILEGTDHTTS